MAKFSRLVTQSIALFFSLGSLPLLACSPLAKITLDLSIISPEGLIGSSDSLRSLDYEFCIPADETFLAEILTIDPTIKHYPQSRGRIVCQTDQYLCIGNTHKSN